MALFFSVGCPKSSVDVGTVETTIGDNDGGGGGSVDSGSATTSDSATSSGGAKDAGGVMDSDGVKDVAPVTDSDAVKDVAPVTDSDAVKDVAPVTDSGGTTDSGGETGAGGAARPSCASLAATCGPLGNEDCCTSLPVPGGTFYRSYDGVTNVSLDGVSLTSKSSPATVSDFHLDKYEVTVGRFRQFVDAGMGTQTTPPKAGAGAHPLIPGSGWSSAWNTSLSPDTAALKAAMLCNYPTWTDTPGNNERLPINCLDWFTASAFCAWDGGRLATEAEWNYAAAGGSEQRVYPWSNPPTSTTIDDSYAAYCGGSCGRPQNVGSKSPKGDGKWGQSDLAGNVWEWTMDWYASPYPMPCTDCSALAVGSKRVVRGGEFNNVESSILSAYRIGSPPESHFFDTGVRCAGYGDTSGAGGSSGAGGTGGAGGAGGSGGTATTARPCDIYAAEGGPCVAAHSTVRALLGTYVGPLYQVRRADGTTKDIPVAPGGFADHAVQDAFCGSTACTISIIYDQSGRGNHLTKAPPGGAKATADNEADAKVLPIMVGGYNVYGEHNPPGVGYRNDTAVGTATGDDPETIYMVTSGDHYNSGCCFDYGNAETNNHDNGEGTMEAVNFGNCILWNKGSGAGPWVMGDLENGLWAGNTSPAETNTSVSYKYVTALVKGDKAATNHWAIKAGNAQSGGLTTMFDGIRPSARYIPMKKEGAIVLGISGDNSNSAQGNFFEGLMTAHYSSNAADDAVQANIVAARYGQ